MNAPVLPSALPLGKPKVSCRPIEARDLDGVADLLARGFPERTRDWWAAGLARMGEREQVDAYPRWGHLIDAGGAVVGCLLTLYSRVVVDGRERVRGNVSSWYVDPDYRFQAAMLVSVVFRQKEVTFTNTSPAPHTIPILLAQGYTQYVTGQVVSAPAFLPRLSRAKVTPVGADYAGPLDAVVADMDLLRRHAALGCMSLVVSRGDAHEPFVFARRSMLAVRVPAAQLVWCRDVAALAPNAVAIARHLLRRDLFAMSIDATGPIAGLPGVWRPGNAPKFFKGPDRPRLGDLADSELVVFQL